MKSFLTQKAYRWSLVSYASPDEIQRVCEKALHYAYILHDKDNNEPHRHVLLVFRSQRTLSAMDSGTLANMIFAVFDAPVKTINGLLDFEVLGINMRNFFLSLVSVTLIGFIISKFR